MRATKWMRMATFLGAVACMGGRAEADLITYTYTGGDISGSFEVDQAHIGTTGDTDISAFITGLTFTDGASTFTAPSFQPSGITVAADGDLTTSAGQGDFFGGDEDGAKTLIVVAKGMSGQLYDEFATSDGTTIAGGQGNWTHTPLAAVPEPSSLTLCGLAAVALAGYARRRKARA